MLLLALFTTGLSAQQPDPQTPFDMNKLLKMQLALE
jgi:hypothetical protein